MRVLAVAETDSFVKWAAWTLERAPRDWEVDLVLARSAVAPSARQVDVAVEGTRFDGRTIDRCGAVALMRRLRSERPDVLLLACTGPTVAAISLLARFVRSRTRVVCGLPGIAIPVRDRAIHARALVDVFVAHSVDERDRYAAAFRSQDLPCEVALSTLPFLRGDVLPAAPLGAPAVFAAQPSVPPDRSQRIELLDRLAALGPPAPIVKLRAERTTERLTHTEDHPYPQLWDSMVEAGLHERGALEFDSGSFERVLARAGSIITVSSTAALEAIDRGRPVLIVSDFGVDDALLNEVFIGSGLVGSLASNRGARSPASDWADRHYFHGRPMDDWVAVVERAVSARRASWRSALGLGYAKAVWRGLRRIAGRRPRR